MSPPLSSPKPPEPHDSPTGEFPVTRKQMRKTVRGVVAVLGAFFTTVGAGGGAWLHNKSSTHVEERTAALEARHDSLRERLEKVESKVDAMRDEQAAAEQAARARQAELLEAVRHGRH